MRFIEIRKEEINQQHIILKKKNLKTREHRQHFLGHMLEKKNGEIH